MSVTRTKIVDAAMVIVRDQGVSRLTLDEAAKRAGMSKGGVLYHFKSKDELVRGMVQRMLEQCDALLQNHYAAEPEGAYRWSRALVRMAFDPEGPPDHKIGGALLAAVTVNPDLVAPIQAAYDSWTARAVSDSPDPLRAKLVCMAMDGYYFQRLMGISLFNERQRDQMKEFVLNMIDAGKSGE